MSKVTVALHVAVVICSCRTLKRFSIDVLKNGFCYITNSFILLTAANKLSLIFHEIQSGCAGQSKATWKRLQDFFVYRCVSSRK